MIMFVGTFLEMCAEGVKGETIIFIMSSQINFQYGEIRIFPLNFSSFFIEGFPDFISVDAPLAAIIAII